MAIDESLTDIDWSEWDTKCKYRGVDHKRDEYLAELRIFYRLKYGEIERILEAVKNVIEIKILEAKLIRIKDKYDCVRKEIEGRELAVKEFVDREIHDTIYYIDLDGGNDGADGLTTGNAWLTLAQYTTTTVRTAGDIAYIRANTSESYASTLAFDEDGTAILPISIIGCDSVTNDPWSDSSDVQPTFTMTSAAYTYFSFDNFWNIENMEFINASTSTNVIYNFLSYGNIYTNCTFHSSNGTPTASGINIRQSNISIIDCDFYDLGTYGVNMNTDEPRPSFVLVKGCTFNGGANSTDYGIRAQSVVDIIDCDFGQTTSHDTADIQIEMGTKIRTRNCKFDSGVSGSSLSQWEIYNEDIDAYGGHEFETNQGVIVKDTVTVRGAADSSAKITPNSNCNINQPLQMYGNYMHELDPAFKLYCSAASTTVHVWIRADSAFSTYPLNTELYVEVSYLNHATLATRATAVSTDVLSDGSTWVDFDVNFTPAQEGWAYIHVKLGDYEAGRSVFVSVEDLV